MITNYRGMGDCARLSDSRSEPAKLHTATDPGGNRLLAALSRKTWSWLQPHLRVVHVPLGGIQQVTGARVAFAYFPINCAISLLHVMRDGFSTETALVRDEGMVGVTLLSGDTVASSCCAVTHIPGDAYRLSAYHVRQAFSQAGDFRSLLLRYTHALMTQTAQAAACYRHHNTEQQLCRWLLLSADKHRSTHVAATQDALGRLLSVGTEQLDASARNLQALGIIRYRDGAFTVINRSALEKRCCECYRTVERAFARLIPSRPTRGSNELGGPWPTLNQDRS